MLRIKQWFRQNSHIEIALNLMLGGAILVIIALLCLWTSLGSVRWYSLSVLVGAAIDRFVIHLQSIRQGQRHSAIYEAILKARDRKRQRRMGKPKIERQSLCQFCTEGITPEGRVCGECDAGTVLRMMREAGLER